MQHHHPDPATLRLDRTVRDLGPGASRWPLILGAAGLVVAVIAAIVRAFAFPGEDALRRLMFAYLHNYLYFLSICLGALFFVMVHHLVRAGWSVVVRRVAEAMAASVWVFALLFLPILISVWTRSGVIFLWSNPEFAEAHPLVAHKEPYLNPIFFTIRAAIYFGLWYYLANRFFRSSLEQDATGDPAITSRLEGPSAWGLIATFLTVSFAAFDWAMSLDPEWFSTIFGVWFIAGCMIGFFAALWVIVYVLQSRGLLAGAVTVEHQHDIGKYLFGFVVFWAYISFCQYLLYWYGDIPEETRWFLVRKQHGWGVVGWTLTLAHFFIPFFGLMSRHVKRNRKLLLFWACWMLAMHWIDLYWVVMPNIAPANLPFGVIDVACFLGIGGLALAGVVRTAGAHALVPLRDPRLHESLAFHNI